MHSVTKDNNGNKDYSKQKTMETTERRNIIRQMEKKKISLPLMKKSSFGSSFRLSDTVATTGGGWVVAGKLATVAGLSSLGRVDDSGGISSG